LQHFNAKIEKISPLNELLKKKNKKLTSKNHLVWFFSAFSLQSNANYKLVNNVMLIIL